MSSASRACCSVNGPGRKTLPGAPTGLPVAAAFDALAPRPGIIGWLKVDPVVLATVELVVVVVELVMVLVELVVGGDTTGNIL